MISIVVLKRFNNCNNLRYVESLMKSTLLIFFLTLTIYGHSEERFTDNPKTPFSTSKNITNKTMISWRQVENVQVECTKESKKRGFAGFPNPIQACSFWDKGISGYSCLIISGTTLNMHTLGHETRHCFQGAFHP